MKYFQHPVLNGILLISKSVFSLIRFSLKKTFFCNRRDNFSDIGFKDIPLTTLPLGLPISLLGITTWYIRFYLMGL